MDFKKVLRFMSPPFFHPGGFPGLGPEGVLANLLGRSRPERIGFKTGPSGAGRVKAKQFECRNLMETVKTSNMLKRL
jgi:hypothetical protein